jgi:hypothetical protein
MNNLLNSEATHPPRHRLHRGANMISSSCSARTSHRKGRLERAMYEDVTCLNDELELVEIRYQALRARMVLEELFSQGFPTS